MIKKIIKSLKLPNQEILFLHVRLKGIDEKMPYLEQTKQIIGYLNEFYNPKTILIPTYTYSFTKTGLFDRDNTPSEVGRFGEEARLFFGSSQRTINPVFSVIDTDKLFVDKIEHDVNSSFNEGSLFYILANIGYLMININLDVLRPAHLHFMEWNSKVPYRYEKEFRGVIISKAIRKQIKYNYFVRDLETNPQWDRKRIQLFLERKNVVKNKSSNRLNLLWMHSKDMDNVLNPVLEKSPYFLLK